MMKSQKDSTIQKVLKTFKKEGIIKIGDSRFHRLGQDVAVLRRKGYTITNDKGVYTYITNKFDLPDYYDKKLAKKL